MQTQISPILPKLQANNTATGSKAEPASALANLFGSILAQGRAQADSPTGPAAEIETETPAISGKPEETPEENLAVLAAAITQPASQSNQTDNPLLAEAVELVDQIVSILEGYPGNNTPPNTDIGSLLQKLNQLLTELELPQAAEALQLAEEVQARMPIPENTADSSPIPEKLLLFVEQLRRDLCPPENVNDDALPLGKTTGQPPPAPGIADQTTGQETDAEHQPSHERKLTPVTEKPDTAAEQKPAPEQTGDLPSRFDLAAERSIASVRAQTVPAQAPLAPENLFDAMVERINVPFSENPHMEIQLKPDNLGKIAVDLVLTENGLTAKILTQDEGVRNLLAAQINQLSNALVEKGIKVESVDVAYAPLADRNFEQTPHQKEQGQSGKQQRLLALEHLEAVPVYEAFYELAPYDSSLGLSSVEYHA